MNVKAGRFLPLSALLGLMLVGSFPARADLVVERTVREFGNRPEAVKPADADKGEAPAAAANPAPAPKPEIVELTRRHYTVKMAAGKLRETCQESGEVTIVRSDLEKVWLIDPARQTYQELSFQGLSAAAAEARKRLYRRLPLVTDPAARRKLEELLDADRKPPELAIERPGTAKKVLDEECDLVIVKAGGEELFRAFVARQPAPAADPRWLRCGALLPSEAAARLAEIKGLVMEAVFPLPDGGRVEVTTDRLSEAGEKPEDYADPATLRFTRVGSFKPPPADKDKPKLKPKDKGEEKKSQPSAPAP